MGLTSEIQSFMKNYYSSLTVPAYNDSWEKRENQMHTIIVQLLQTQLG